MALNGIDISDYQKGINLDKVPFDFMICKITEGTNIEHKTHAVFIESARKKNKLWGFYHFMNDEDPVAQANYFYEKAKRYFGYGIPVLDYETYGRIGVSGAKKFLDRIYKLTGVRCVVYMSRSVCTEEDWSKIAPLHKLWVAQYANNNTTGYQSDPWRSSGKFGAWNTCTIHQYTSHGRLNGYGGNLDLDIAYLTRDEWMKIARGDKFSPSSSPLKLIDKIAEEVISGIWGNGSERKTKLEKAGYDYDEVQKAVNKKISNTSSLNRIYTVKKGDTLSGIGLKLSIDWRYIASKNKIKPPYTIYLGQKLKY